MADDSLSLRTQDEKLALSTRTATRCRRESACCGAFWGRGGPPRNRRQPLFRRGGIMRHARAAAVQWQALLSGR